MNETESKSILEQNIKSFSHPRSVENYTHTYLRSSERYVIDTYTKAGKRVLDLGCGAGRTTKYIAEKGAEVIGVDLSEELIKKAHELYPTLTFKVMNALRLDFPDEYFDVVFFSFNGLDNMHPISERMRALEEMKRVTKKGGYIIYSSHNALSIPRTKPALKIALKNFFRLRPWAHYRKEDHGYGELVQYYNNIASEKQFIKKAGLQVVEVKANGRVDKLPKGAQFFLERFPMYITTV